MILFCELYSCKDRKRKARERAAIPRWVFKNIIM